MTSTTLQFSNDTVSAQLNNGSESQLCVYRVREDERFKCESFAVAVLPPNRYKTINQSSNQSIN